MSNKEPTRPPRIAMIIPTIARKVINTVALCCALWLGSIGPAWAVEVTDLFNRANTSDPHDIGANWDPTSTPFAIVTNAVRITEATGTCGGNPCVETWNANSFTNDQFAEITVKTLTETVGPTGQGVVLRHSGTAETWSGYYCQIYPSFSSIKKLVAGSETPLADDSGATSWTTGDKMRCTVSGASPNITITLYKNDVQVIQATSETEFASGRVGIQAFSGDGTDNATNEIDAFRGGDGDGAPAAPTSRAPLVVIVE